MPKQEAKSVCGWNGGGVGCDQGRQILKPLNSFCGEPDFTPLIRCNADTVKSVYIDEWSILLDRWRLNADKKYYRKLLQELSVILLSCIKLVACLQGTRGFFKAGLNANPMIKVWVHFKVKYAVIRDIHKGEVVGTMHTIYWTRYCINWVQRIHAILYWCQ